MKSYTLSRNSGIADKRQWKILGGAIVVTALILGVGIFAVAKAFGGGDGPGPGAIIDEGPVVPPKEESAVSLEKDQKVLYMVSRVVDGDTIDVMIDGSSQRVRLIGVNTPETVAPNLPQECFGQEASDYMKQLLTGKQVELEADTSQGELDKYGRLLRYVFLDGQNVNLKLIADGYAYEYTYNVPYKYQSEFKAAQKVAEANNMGLWAPTTCNGQKTAVSASQMQSQADQQAVAATQSTQSVVALAQSAQPSESCTIKGNISSSGEKIYHVPGQKYYDATKIDTTKGERWFCTEQEAVAAGWRKAKV